MNDHIEYNALISPPRMTPGGIALRLVMEKRQPRPQLVLVIDESTTIKGVENGWYKILEIRDELYEKIGNDLNLDYKIVLYELSEMHKQGRKWVEIEKIVNYRCLACLYAAYEEREDNPIGLGWYLLYTHFIALKRKDEDFQARLDVSFDDLRMNRIPWKLRGGLFDNGQIEEKVNYFREQVGRGTIIVAENSDPEIDADDMMIYLKGYYEKVNTLLENTDRMYWKENEEWIRKRLKSISEKIETSNDPVIKKIRDA
jgi:hypothetical protein